MADDTAAPRASFGLISFLRTPPHPVTRTRSFQGRGSYIGYEVRGLLTPDISGVPTARRTLTIDQPGKYTLGVTGEGALAVSVVGCPREGDPIPSMPGSYGHAVYVGMLDGVAGELIPAGESRTLDLLAMRHRVVVSTAAEGLEVSLSVRRVPE